MSSSQGGYLQPDASPAPSVDNPLVDFFQEYVVGITGLTASLVRPRWQPEAPDIPAWGVTWAAIGITERVQDTYGAEIHFPTQNGNSQLRRHDVITVSLSFYGPQAEYNVSLFSDGLQIAQNREILSLNNMGLVDSGNIVHVPVLIKERWVDRYDLEFRVKRQTVRVYEVETLLSATATVVTDEPHIALPVDSTLEGEGNAKLVIDQ